MAQEPSQESNQPEASVRGPLSEFDAFSKTIVSSMKGLSDVAEKGVSNFLLALGTILLFVTLFMKLRPLGVQVAELASSEFIFVLLVSALFIVIGTYLRLYQYRTEREISRSLTETGSRLIEKAVEASARIQEKGVDVAKDLTKPEKSRPL